MVCSRARIDDRPSLGLGPLGELGELGELGDDVAVVSQSVNETCSRSFGAIGTAEPLTPQLQRERQPRQPW